MEFKGKNVLVTGGAVRVGAAFSRAFASKGSNVIIHCNKSKEEAEALLAELPPGNHKVISQDLFAPNAAGNIFSQAGKVDILINNASVFFLYSDGETDEQFNYQYRVNFLAPFELMGKFRAQSPQGACVINILDQRIHKTDPKGGSYYLSKKALAEATVSSALRWAPNIRVNGIAPGPVLPPVGMEDSKMEKTLKEVPLARPVAMDDMTDACLFLVKNESITGQILYVDCGQSLN
jgi:NAD(P)-dependent dehydrogenase (short-subunit alcohol dehydrogenase family)